MEDESLDKFFSFIATQSEKLQSLLCQGRQDIESSCFNSTAPSAPNRYGMALGTKHPRRATNSDTGAD